MLLELNLPRYNGHQILAKIRADAELSDLPVVILSTSSAEEDVVSSYRLFANAYVTKPTDLDEFTSAVRQIDEFFTQLARLPSRGQPPDQISIRDPMITVRSRGSRK